jgi:uncharacterized protein (TIGR03382 family)
MKILNLHGGKVGDMKCTRPTVGLAGVVLASAWLGHAGIASAQAPNPNSKLCFINVIGVPGPFYLKPPVIDGCLRACSYPSDAPSQHDDFGWQSAFQFVANPINIDPPTGDVVAQGIYDPAGPGKLDLSFEVKNDTRLDETDAVVIALQGSVPGTTGNHALLVIYPFVNHAGSAYNGPIGGAVGQVQYYGGTSGGNSVTWNPGFESGPSWVTAAVNSGGAGTSWTWTVEVQIRRNQIEGATGINLSNTGFNFFFDVIRVYNQAGFEAFDMPWPPAATVGTVPSSPPTPNLDQWGAASVNSGVCGGVSFLPSDIKTNQANPYVINTNPANPNRFSVALKNTLIDTRTGPNQNKPMIAKAVTAKFRIANFGLPSDQAWVPIPAANDISNTADVPAATTIPASSTVPPAVIGPAGTVTLQTKAPGWDASTAGGSTHQCILAELSSPNNDVVFVNKSAYQNMNYGFNPGFEPVAAIDGRWGEPPGGKSTHTFDLLKIPTFQYAYGDGTIDGIPVGKLTAQVNLTFIGYRHTGRFVTLRSQKTELVTPVGYYGYVVQHELGDDIAVPFTQRHDRQIKIAFDFNGTEGQKWARVNKALLDDPEKPTTVDWNLDFPDLKPVAETSGAVVRIEVPRDTVSTVVGTIRYTGGASSPGGGGCCPGRSGATTTPKVGTLGLVVLVGAVLGRRRRRAR